MEIKEILYKFPSKRPFTNGIHSLPRRADGRESTVTVTVIEEFVVRPLQLVRWRITQSNCRV